MFAATHEADDRFLGERLHRDRKEISVASVGVRPKPWNSWFVLCSLYGNVTKSLTSLFLGINSLDQI